MKKNHSLQLSTLTILGILFSAAIVLAYTYYYTVDKPYLDKRLILHQEILSSRAASPYQYRILVPVLGEILFKIANLALPERYAFALAYVLIDLSGISLLLISIYYLLLQWFDWRYTLIGTLFCASVLTITYQEHYFQPWSFWEAGFFNLALLLIYKRRNIWLAVLIILASLNRETALLIPLVFLFTTQKSEDWLKGKWSIDKQQLLLFAGYTLLWIAVYGSLRIFRPAGLHIESLKDIFFNNIIPVNIAKTVLNLILFMGVFWLLALCGWKRAPLFIRKAAMLLPCYLPLYLIFAYWREVRVLIFIYPIVIALGLSIFPDSKLSADQN